MRKNKKNGFTLIELIATVVLIAVLATVILVNMTGIKSNEDNSKAARFQKNIEEAACAYIDMNENTALRQRCKNNSSAAECKIKLSTLSSNSVALIDPDDIDPVTNDKVGNEGNCIYVQVKWNNNGGYKQKVCEMARGASCN